MDDKKKEQTRVEGRWFAESKRKQEHKKKKANEKCEGEGSMNCETKALNTLPLPLPLLAADPCDSLILLWASLA